MRILRAISTWLQVAGATVAVLAVSWLGAQRLAHLQLLAVQTGSMRPTFQPGDALIIHKISPDTLRIGQVVSYRSARNPSELVTHRVVNLNRPVGSFQTKGDRLQAPDPAVRNSLLVGRVTTVLPGFGRPLGWLRTIPGLVVCVYLPAIAIGASELYRLEQQYRRRLPYRLHSRQVI